MDNGVAEGARPAAEIAPGKSGDYARALNHSVFRESHLLRRAAGYIEAGRFAQGVVAVQDELQNRRVSFQFMDRFSASQGTELRPDGSAIFRLEDNFRDLPSFRQLFALLHRNMSLILRRSGLREDPKHTQEILNMDEAFVAALKRAAAQEPDSKKKQRMLDESFYLEKDTQRKQAGMRRQLS